MLDHPRAAAPGVQGTLEQPHSASVMCGRTRSLPAVGETSAAHGVSTPWQTIRQLLWVRHRSSPPYPVSLCCGRACGIRGPGRPNRLPAPPSGVAMAATIECTKFPNPLLTNVPPLSMKPDAVASSLKHHFSHTLGRDRYCKSAHYVFLALALTVRDRLMERWKKTLYEHEEQDARRVYYLSLEFLMGRTLNNAILNLGLQDSVRKAMQELAIDMEQLAEVEADAGLGNGGLGRLAACFLDSCASLNLPVMGYGIRYEYGMFRQRIQNGHQVEEPDHWLRDGHPWELERPEFTQRVRFGGRTETYPRRDGSTGVRWVDTHDVVAVPYDVPIPGYRNDAVNTLRLWSADATDAFDLGEFNAGSYTEAMAAKTAAENITKVLYPNDASENGKELRLRQQYFLASASLQDVLLKWVRQHGDAPFSTRSPSKNVLPAQRHPPEHCAVAGDDAHPARRPGQAACHWDAAWLKSRPGAWHTPTTPSCPRLWSAGRLRLFQQCLLPRLLEIIYEINARFLWLEVASRWPGDTARVERRMSLIEEGDPSRRCAWRMARDRRQLLDQRRRGSCTRELLRRRACSATSMRNVAGTLQQQDQRRHAAALAGRLQPPAQPLDQRAHRRRLDFGSAFAQWPASAGEKCQVPCPLERRPPRQQGAAGSPSTGRDGRAVQSQCALRRASQTHPRVQAPATQRPARDPSVFGHQAR